ncbi:NUDIX hydrolase [Arachidicoccus soli]|uniref:NUDIX domain-containing protein n=1 Tax=Arachidicoccus soli TaxID=2341117 RepID=A0A386HQT6_9BACT|nr:NUDIX domain-containing protein [Arachidicoccus soli]AYD47624.1 NUDIX domain-containing protein [Arachidicoccus soli]
MIKRRYQVKKLLLAVDCIIFGYDDDGLKLLVIERGFEPLKGAWSLVGGFVKETESVEDAANRVLHALTGLEGVYMEQMRVFSAPDRDCEERTVVVAFFALIDIKKYQQQISSGYHAKWVSINDYPELIFDHNVMVEMAKEQLRYRAALHPLLFELLPEKFTIPQAQQLFEELYNVSFDPGNFSRKLTSTNMLIKQTERDKLSSKKGAFYYKLDSKKYKDGFSTFLNFVYKPEFKKKDPKNTKTKDK